MFPSRAGQGGTVRMGGRQRMGGEAEGCPKHPGEAEGIVDEAGGPHPDLWPRPSPCPPPQSPLQGADVSPYFLFLLLFLLQLEGLHGPLHPDDGLHMVLKPVALHVGISTLDFVEHPEKSPERHRSERGWGGRWPKGSCRWGGGAVGRKEVVWAHPGTGVAPLTFSAGKDTLALHTPRRLWGPLGAGIRTGVENGLPPVTLGLYLELRSRTVAGSLPRAASDLQRGRNDDGRVPTLHASQRLAWQGSPSQRAPFPLP